MNAVLGTQAQSLVAHRDEAEGKRVPSKEQQTGLTESRVRENCSMEIMSSPVSSFFCLTMVAAVVARDGTGALRCCFDGARRRACCGLLGAGVGEEALSEREIWGVEH